MRKLLLAAALAFALGGCALLQKIETGISIATGPVVTPQEVYIAINAFDGIEVTATNYLRVTCPSRNACQNPTAAASIITWVRGGRDDRNRLKAGLRASPGQNISLVDVYNDLTITTAKLGSLLPR